MKSRMLVATLTLLFAATSASAADYKIDASHSSVQFKIKHLAISTVSGRFTDFNGTFSFDPKNMAASKADASITAQSINTDHAKRDEHLRNPDFFDTAKFPTLSFKTNRIEAVSADSFKAHGDLNMHGVTKAVVLDVKYGGSVKDPMGTERAAFTATTSISRKDFGLTYNSVLEAGGLALGENVDITIEVEGIRR